MDVALGPEQDARGFGPARILLARFVDCEEQTGDRGGANRDVSIFTILHKHQRHLEFSKVLPAVDEWRVYQHSRKAELSLKWPLARYRSLSDDSFIVYQAVSVGWLGRACVPIRQWR
jgi:hypothetical protein